jgi:hypothetical protein
VARDPVVSPSESRFGIERGQLQEKR